MFLVGFNETIYFDTDSKSTARGDFIWTQIKVTVTEVSSEPYSLQVKIFLTLHLAVVSASGCA